MTQLILPHQRAIYDRLVATGRAYFTDGWHSLPIRPRWHRLLIAQTGSGKTHLARAAAHGCGAAFLKVNLPSWIPLGCTRSQGKHTVQTILETVSNHRRTVLLIDEVDKLRETTSWTTYLLAEVYALLDGDWPAGVDFNSDDTDCRSGAREALARQRLRQRCLIVAAGTWQDVWDRQKVVAIGFNVAAADRYLPSVADLAQTLPQETVNRFSSEILIIPPMTEPDYNAAIAAATRLLPDYLQDRFESEARAAIPGAVTNGSGCRILEETISKILTAEEIEHAELTAAPDDDYGPDHS